MKSLLAILALSGICHAGTMTLAWDHSGAARFEVFRGIEKLAEVTVNEAELTIPDGELSTLHVIAYNTIGESATSEPFTVQPFIVERTFDLINWISVTLYHEVATEQFYRVKYFKP